MLKPKKDAFCSETNFSISSKRVSSLSPWLSFHSDYNKNVQWILNILLINVQVSLLNSHSAYTFLHFIVECTKLHAEIIRNVIMIFLGIYKKEHPLPPTIKKGKHLMISTMMYILHCEVIFQIHDSFIVVRNFLFMLQL